MRPIRHILSGLALLLVSGCMHVSISFSRDQSCVTSCDENCGESCDPCDPCECQPHWWQRFNFISFRGDSCEEECDKPGCCGRAWAFLTYRPLCKSMMDEAGPSERIRPPLFSYFQPSNYNKPLQPIECGGHSWLGGLFCRSDSCCDCADGACGSNDAGGVPVAAPSQVLSKAPTTYQGRSSCVIYGGYEGMQETETRPVATPPVREPAKPDVLARIAAKQVEADDDASETPAEPATESKPPVPIQTVPTPVAPMPVTASNGSVYEAPSCAPCRPRLGLPMMMPRATGAGETCGAGGCGNGRCGTGAAACGRPKPRLDGLPILPPTMFRKYEPCDGPDATTLLAPVPGTSVPVEQVPVAPKRIDAVESLKVAK